MKGVADQYRRALVGTIPPLELVVLIYDAALFRIKRGIEAIEKGNPEEAHANFLKAQEAVGELLASLDMQKGGEIARNLARLYDFIISRLAVANIRKSVKEAKEAERLLRTLRDAWAEASAKNEAKALQGD
ncbi:MAG TPA: flagellar export chaperone FliS [Armatimonadetes bacterium]|nr:flagellar export chaperone FliS [Armatimonadota bacterium]